MKKIRITESQLKYVKQSYLNEGKRVFYKREWDKEDQILAMFNSRYGVAELGFTEEYIANNVIGTSKSSFIMSSANFNSLDGDTGLKNYYKTDRKPEDILPIQIQVHEELKNISREKFKSICLHIIDKKENDPNNVNKFTLGNDVGKHREDIVNTREKLLRDKGHDPKKVKMIGQRPKFDPVVDDEPEVPQSPIRKTPKDEVKSYLKQMYDKFVESNPELADDIQFITDYIDSELVDKEMLSEIRKLFNVTINENKTNKMKKIIRIKESDIRNIVNRIIKEQEFDGNEFPGAEEPSEEEMNINRFQSVISDMKDYGFSKEQIIIMASKLYDEMLGSSNQEDGSGTDEMYENKNTKKVIKLKEVIKKLIKEQKK